MRTVQKPPNPTQTSTLVRIKSGPQGINTSSQQRPSSHPVRACIIMRYLCTCPHGSPLMSPNMMNLHTYPQHIQDPNEISNPHRSKHLDLTHPSPLQLTYTAPTHGQSSLRITTSPSTVVNANHRINHASGAHRWSSAPHERLHKGKENISSSDNGI